MITNLIIAGILAYLYLVMITHQMLAQDKGYALIWPVVWTYLLVTDRHALWPAVSYAYRRIRSNTIIPRAKINQKKNP